MIEELKPCPFCGGEAEYHSDKGPTGEVYGWVGCNQCDAMSCHIDTRSMQPEEAHPIDAWNTRAPSSDHIANAGKMITPGDEELEDLIENAIMESIDMDWVPRDGAKAVVRVLQEEGYIGPVNADLATIAWLDGAHRGKAEAARWQAIAEGLAGPLADIFRAPEMLGKLSWIDAAAAALATYTAAKDGK